VEEGDSTMTHTPDQLTDPSDSVGAPSPLNLAADVLSMVRLTGAIFLRAEYTAPWAIESPPAIDLARMFESRTQRQILFHIIFEGQCWFRLGSGEQLEVGAGEVVVLPYGNQHVMGSATSVQPVAMASLLPPPPPTPQDRPPVTPLRYGGGGKQTNIICGYLHCDDPIFDPILSALPPLFSVKPPSDFAATWIAASIDYALEATTGNRTSSPGLAVRLPELVFNEVLRLYMESAPPLRAGWLAALHDPVVGPALVELHAEPERRWTVEELARRVASSRTVLNERFVRFLGRAPMQYLGEWRLQLASRLLNSTSLSVAAVGYRVGYESEEAFSRAFRRALGMPPGQWRQRAGAYGA
jgi:AraC-like DNA-binding protein